MARKQAQNGQNGTGIMTKYPGKVSLRQAIQETGGVVSDLARHYNNASRTTIYRWLDQAGLRDKLADARAKMDDVSLDVIYARLMDADEEKSWEAAKFIQQHVAPKRVDLTSGGAPLKLYDGVSPDDWDDE
jgi:transposase-like protein